MSTTTCINEYELRHLFGKAVNNLRTAVERCTTIGTPGVSDDEADELLAAAMVVLEEARQAAESLAALDDLTHEAQLMLAYGEPTFESVERLLEHLR
jgi:hypothetical protein